MAAAQSSVLELLLSVCLIVQCCAYSRYCSPCNSTCWPDNAAWDQLKQDLGGRLHRTNTTQYKTCSSVASSDVAAWTLLDAENGICMQHHNCAHDRCKGSGAWNLPAYAVRAESDADISTALAFANRYNIPVSIKTSGHSYSGSSTLKGSLLIWMRHFTKYGTRQSFTDSCGNTTDTTVKIGGGQVWHEAYTAAGADYDIVGGGGKTVSAAGGWLQGGGLSAMSPSYGLGIDNVLQFEVILASGQKVVADECSETDLFWALRGGGGGTFGVVTSVVYRIYPVSTTMVELVSYIDLSSYATSSHIPGQGRALESWMHKWVDLQQGSGLDSRWGGYWQISAGFGLLYFLGSEADANSTLLTELENWTSQLPSDVRKWVHFSHRVTPSYFNGTGRSDRRTDMGSHQKWSVESRLIPRSWVLENGGVTAKEALTRMLYAGKSSFTLYQLGGAVSKVGASDTSIHPAMRTAQWSMVADPGAIEYVQEIPGSGTCMNHHGDAERELSTLWGSNLQRLQQIKQTYDPANRFNCYHCVGWQDLGTEEVSDCPAATTTTSGTPPAATANGAPHHAQLKFAVHWISIMYAVTAVRALA